MRLQEQHPIRKQLFSKEQMLDHCRSVAEKYTVYSNGSIGSLIKRLYENEKVILNIYGRLQDAAQRGRFDMQTGELTINMYLVRDQLLKTKGLLNRVQPRLPYVKDLSGKSLPRVYNLIQDIIAHTHAQLDTPNLISFLCAYQEKTSLEIYELKAICAMIKLALVENLRRTMVHIASLRPGVEPAAFIADRVFMRNSISCLSMLDTIDWQKFEDQVSNTEPILCSERSCVYAQMDYSTRDTYRKNIGKIARLAGMPELQVAQQVVKLADAENNSAGNIRSHVGYFIIGKGRPYFERTLGISFIKRTTPGRIMAPYTLLFYLGCIAVISGGIGGAFIYRIHNEGLSGMSLAIAGLLILFCVSQPARLLVDAFASAVIKPALLPRMDFSIGIPPHCRTLVIVPAMLTGITEIDELVHALEVRFLANRDDHLHFGLLTDHTDALQEICADDDRLLQYVRQKIEALNVKYGSSTNDIFFLFHRPRKWNAAEQLWMGYERKRGKLMDLNALLKGRVDNSFSCIIGNGDYFNSIKFVITLDADTQLPKDAAWKMVGSMMHPLNRAVYSTKKKRVIAGYGLLQPRIGTDLRGGE